MLVFDLVVLYWWSWIELRSDGSAVQFALSLSVACLHRYSTAIAWSPRSLQGFGRRQILRLLELMLLAGSGKSIHTVLVHHI